MTLRRAAARRVEFIASLSDAVATLIRLADIVGPDTVVTTKFDLTVTVGSKAEADEIIEACAPAARALWRNGVYMAELDLAKVEVPPDEWSTLSLVPPSKLSAVSKLKCGGVSTVMHFVPPIVEQAA
jgi:hypothetical protein